MRSLILLFAALVFTGDEVPFKPKDEYELKMEFLFKSRPNESGTYNVELKYERTSQSGGPLPYLILHLSVLKQLEDEVRIKVVTNNGNTLVGKKLDKDKKITIDLGFTDDLKDHVKPHEYTYLFLDAARKVKRKIVVHFEADGTYLVNSEKRGKI
jgi:hypothetical protein